jgi:acetate kinase
LSDEGANPSPFTLLVLKTLPPYPFSGLEMTILTINSGSSSIKASLFHDDGSRRDFHYGHVRKPHEVFDRLMLDLGGEMPCIVGHRFVHGGDIADASRRVDAAERARLENLIPLAPLHLPGNLLGIDLCTQHFDVPQVACFDTAFHFTMPELAKRLPIPSELGLRRFGFHGLNYAHIAKMLPGILGETAHGKIVVAHLGSGASLCLMENLKSVDTSMGYTPAGGIVMGTRSGDLDPGVMLELAQRFSAEELSDIVFHKMGLIALSEGEDSEMSDLVSSTSENAKFAVAYFCRQVRAAIGGFAAKVGGIDALVFSGGIGEHSAEIRTAICDPLKFLGFELENESNRNGQRSIGLPASKPIVVIPADEEGMIRDLCLEYLILQEK